MLVRLISLVGMMKLFGEGTGETYEGNEVDKIGWGDAGEDSENDIACGYCENERAEGS